METKEEKYASLLAKALAVLWSGYSIHWINTVEYSQLFMMQQGAEEVLGAYFAVLRTLASTCNLGDYNRLSNQTATVVRSRFDTASLPEDRQGSRTL